MWITGTAFLLAHLFLLIALLIRSRRAARFALPRRSELFWLVTTGAVFIWLAVAGSRSWARTANITPEKEVIEVYARQFAWSFRYPGPDKVFGRTKNEFISDSGGNPMGVDPADPAGKDDLITNSLRIPAGRDVVLLLHARDVIHDFFVRELRTKQDVVPGMEIPIALHVDVPGQYEIACAELCGLGHSQMRGLLIVMAPDEYQKWQQTAQASR